MSEDRDNLGALLLAELAVNPDSPCGRQFDALFYEFIWRRLRRHHASISSRVARYLGLSDATAPLLTEADVDEVAHVATSRALRRVRDGAERFDPSRGTATNWVIGASEFAFVEVAKEIVQARQPQGFELVGLDRLESLSDRSPTTEEHVLNQIASDRAVAEAADILTENEWNALRLTATLGFSYAEAAAIIFGNSGMTKAVDGLLSRGKAKLRQAWAERRPPTSPTETSSVQDGSDEMEDTNE